MPIRPDLRHLYRGAAWRAIRARILARAGNACEQCGKPNGERVWVYDSGGSGQYWTRLVKPVSAQSWTYCELGGGGNFILVEPVPGLGLRQIRVKIGVAHLDHNAANNAEDNLKALCDWCHLHYDKLHHRQTRATRKDRERPILQAAKAPERLEA